MKKEQTPLDFDSGPLAPKTKEQMREKQKYEREKAKMMREPAMEKFKDGLPEFWSDLKIAVKNLFGR